MTIRIDSIRSILTDAGYRWAVLAKGLYGRGIYFTAETGLDGLGLYATANNFEIEPARDGCRVVDVGKDGRPTIELIEPDRFHVHVECDATAAVHRITTALVMIGWGPELIDDRDSISGGGAVTAIVNDFRRSLHPTEGTDC